MKIIGVQDLPCYRMHTPKWSVAPTSGAGAATQGGRVNRKGLEALYLSLESATAIAEFQQASAFLPPGLLVSYSLSLDRVIDFTGGYDDTWAPVWQDFFCDWRRFASTTALNRRAGSSGIWLSRLTVLGFCSSPLRTLEAGIWCFSPISCRCMGIS